MLKMTGDFGHPFGSPLCGKIFELSPCPLTLYSVNSYRPCSLLVIDLGIISLSKIFHSLGLLALG